MALEALEAPAQELLEVLEFVGARLVPVALQGYAFIGAKGSRPLEEVADWADVRGPNGIGLVKDLRCQLHSDASICNIYIL